MLPVYTQIKDDLKTNLFSHFTGLGIQHMPLITSHDPDIKQESESICSLGQEIKQEFQPSLDQTFELKQECQIKQEHESLFGEGLKIKQEVQSEEDKGTFLSNSNVPKLEETTFEEGGEKYTFIVLDIQYTEKKQAADGY